MIERGNTKFLGIIMMVAVCYAKPADNKTIESILLQKSEQIRLYMNSSHDPCDNFYKFACGNWATVYPASKDLKKTSFSVMAAKLYEQNIVTMLTSSDTKNNDILKTVKEFYLSCMARPEDTKAYREKLLKIVNEFGKMPIIEKDGNWHKSDFDWLKVIGEIAFKYNKNILLGFSIRPDFNDPKVNCLVLKHFDYPLRDLAHYLNASNEKYRQEYRDEIANDLINFLDIEPEIATVTSQQIVDFEISLVSGAKSGTVPGGETLAITSVAEIQKYYGKHMDIKKLLMTTFGFVPFLAITERVPGYQKNIIKLLKTVSPAIVANYIFYSLLRHFIAPLRRKPKTFLQDSCIQTTRQYFHPFIENTMYQYLNLDKSEADIQTMFSNIKEQFQNDFKSDKYDWISQHTRQHAVNKLDAMTLQIDTFDFVNFKQKYGGIQITPHDFIENLKLVYIKDALDNRHKLKVPPIKSIPSRIEEGPYYSLYKNFVHMPIVKLSPYSYWSRQLPNVANYAQLGVLLAHETVHGFTYKGQHFNASGSSGYWWDKNSKKEYETRSQCFSQQYSKYSYNGKLLPNDKDQSENIADNGGIQLAHETFIALWNSTVVGGEVELFSNLNFTTSQLFFILYAQQYCTDVLPLYTDEVMDAVHSPANLRVIGALTNFEEFSREFKCEKGKPMNGEHKCIIF